MKIGLSYSRCVRDIVDGKIDMADVLVIISRTHFDPRDDDQWTGIWQGYTTGNGFSAREWSNYDDEDEQLFRAVSVELWQEGKLHQPRQFGAAAIRRREIWLEVILPLDELELNSTAKDAWDRFQVLAGLSNVSIDKFK